MDVNESVVCVGLGDVLIVNMEGEGEMEEEVG